MDQEAAERVTAGSPQETRYDADVKLRQMSVEDVRKGLGGLAQQGGQGELDEHVAVTRHGKVGVVVVPVDWYRQARRALKDPTDL